jgi:arylsulfatase A-like enzyme
MADKFNRRWFLRQAGLGFAAAPVLRAARRPNIVLIYADDVGYGDIGCYGATAVRTPNLDRIAGQGVRFTNAHATSATCTPSRFSLLTGEYAWRQQGTGILPGDAPLIIPPGRLTLPGILRSAGYRTGVVGKWHLGLGAGKIDWNGEITPGPNEIGFDYSFIIPATPDRVPCVLVENHRVVNLDPADPISVSYQQAFPGELTGRDHPELLKMKPSHGHDGAIVNGVSRIGFMQGGRKALWVDENFADILTSKATAFVDAHRQEPFFLYYAAHEIHVPRMPNARFVGSTGMGPRGDSIAELDWCVGRILDALERNGLTRDTLVLFSSDNGPVLDDGYRDQAAERVGKHKPAGEYRGGKYSNFEGGTRVPLMARWPGQIRADSVSPALVSQVDLLASLGALTGKTPSAAAALDSRNLLPVLLGRTPRGRDSLTEYAGALAVVQGDWKLIEGGKGAAFNAQTGTELGNSPVPQLYNIRTDPGEKIDVAKEHPELVTRMSALLEKIKRSPKD